MTAEQQLRAFIADVRRQIGIAEDAGADHKDLCIAVPASYMTFAAGWPTIDLHGRAVALVPKLWARDLADEAVAETSTAPLELADQGGGLWGFTPSPPAPRVPTNPVEQAQAALKLWEPGA
jgi:hypothetical protein